MTSRLTRFLAERSAETYPEPRSAGHDGITAQIAPGFAARLPPGGRVLDVGCGQGPALVFFRQAGLQATGITTNEEDLAACRALGVTALRIDMNDLPEEMSARFDGVWARHVLEHSVIPFFTLHEFARVLRPGGILYAEMPAPDTACHHEANGNHYSVFGVRMWGLLITRAGFEILEIRQIELQTGVGPDLYYSIIARRK